MKEKVVRIDLAGRIVLPKAVRRELGVEPGDRLKVTIRGQSVMLTLNKEAAGLVRKGKALVFTTVGDSSLESNAIQIVLENSRAERDSEASPLPRRRKRRV